MDAYHDEPAARRSKKPLLLALGGSFALGIALAGFLFYQYDQNRDNITFANVGMGDDSEVEPEPVASVANGAALPSPSPSATRTAAAAERRQAVQGEQIEGLEQQQGGIDQRLAAAEQRLARLDLQMEAASGNAARAEGLLIAFASRRALQRGEQLNYLADQLRVRFADRQPNAVNTLIQFSQDPVTLDELLARLEGLAPELERSSDEPSFERIKRELSSLFVIRRDQTPSLMPQRRLRRARLFLESGRVEPAIEEVRKLPGAERASGWINDAQRYAAAYQALDLLEATAVLDTRGLRDGRGNRVQQPSPAGNEAE
ncbi:hypothetical protein [Qipengyuania atrilutea]|uniref:Inner membrane protein n=1 Tax=Qipengyuania atrilutea TaxID=2744473 RepID=A0A850GZC5_9SPHN|nr:hypothetical protein [Actirhodobacter atriluteus]NVD43560.1 hypothetical protein [Actirhodobacter atriluteus]